MGKIKAVVEFDMKIEDIYNDLKNRYRTERFKKVSMDVKGYCPKIKLLNSEENSKLFFSVKGYDPLIKIHIGSWQWAYLLKEIGENKTELTVYYKWSFFMTLASLGTVKHQAGNELIETIIALDSLEKLKVLNEQNL